MTVFDLTPEMAADAAAFDRWQQLLDANLLVKRHRRPVRRAAAKLGHQRRKEGVRA